MRPFAYRRAGDIAAALRGAPERNAGAAAFLAGGTTLVDLMKLQVMAPAVVVDINDLAQHYGSISADARTLRLGALVRMSQAAEHQAIRRDYPMIVQSLELAASPQLRHMASLGGNVLQRTRCTYFRDISWKACNKRDPGSGCAALEGNNRKHAILGVSDQCIASYPGDFAQALMAFDASVELAGPNGSRIIPFASLHQTPGSTPQIETILRPGELITAFVIKAAPWTRRSLFIKVRDRQSYEFALASAAVALDLRGNVANEARIALGGVASKPWRAHEAEAALKGKEIKEATAEAAATAAFSSVKTHRENKYKVDLGKRTLVRALLEAARMKL